MLTLLSGCVNHYQPVYDDELGVYYTDEGVFYEAPTSTHPGTSPANFAVYPWWSMDYFYLGYHPYSTWAHVYYSPYFYPHYFSVMYPPWHWYPNYGYGGYHAWRNPYWYHHYRRFYASALPPVVEPWGKSEIGPGGKKGKPGRWSLTKPAGTSASVNPYPVGAAGQFRATPAISGLVAPSNSTKRASIPVRKASVSGTKPFRYEKSHPVRIPSPPAASRSTTITPASSIPSINTSRGPVKQPNPYQERK